MEQNDVKQLSWDALAAQLGTTRQSLVLWRKLPEAPADRDPVKWSEFIKQNELGAGPKQGPLKDEKMKLETELLRARLDRESRRTISREEVSGLLLHISTRGRAMLYQFLETEAPPKLDGLPAAQMRPILREMADSIAGEMADLIAQFEAQ